MHEPSVLKILWVHVRAMQCFPDGRTNVNWGSDTAPDLRPDCISDKGTDHAL